MNAHAKELPDLNVTHYALHKMLWTHQTGALSWAKDHDGALWDMGMGTGKTLAALAFIDAGQYFTPDFHRVLIIAPKTVVSVWREHVQKFCPQIGDCLYLDNDRPNKVKAAAVKKQIDLSAARNSRAIIVMNYDAAWRESMKQVLFGVQWDVCILDEAHRIKAAGSRVSEFFGHLAKRCRRRIGLTGTPMPNTPLDIYGTYRFLDSGVFGTNFTAFKARYAVMGGADGRTVVKFQNKDEMREKINSIRYKVSRDVLDLPEAIHTRRYFSLATTSQIKGMPAPRKVYDQLKDDLFAVLDSDSVGNLAEMDGDDLDELKTVTVDNVLVKLLRLQQITSGYVPADDPITGKGNIDDLVALHTARREVLADLLDELRGQPVVVFCKFRPDLGNVAAAAESAGLTCSELSGRINQLEEWKNGDTDVLAVQISAGSEGISLVRAQHTVFYSLDHSLAKYSQALARTHRPGQDETCYFHHILCDDSVDTAIMDAYESKTLTINSILNPPAIAR